MKFALLGLDDDTLALCHAILDSDEHDLVALHNPFGPCREGHWPAGMLEGESDSREAAVARIDEVPLAELASRADVVIVSRPEPGKSGLDNARFIARQGVAMVISQPLSLSALDCYELEMACSETGKSLVPLLANFAAPQLQRLLELATNDANDEIGQLEQIVMHRRLGDRSRAVVMQQFACDAVLLSMLCGEVKSVAAMGPEVTAEKYSNLNVQMAGADGRIAHWSIEPAESDEDRRFARLSLVGDRGTLTLELTNLLTLDQWRLKRGEEEIELASSAKIDLAAEIVRELEAEKHESPVAESPAAKLPTWREATRGVELAETVSSSLKKGRTIKLRAEGRGEEQAFKGTMAAAGCAILIGIMMLMFGLAVAMFIARASGVEWIQNVAGIVRYWPHALLFVLVAFLLIQLLRFVIPRDDGNSR